jgi:hypothetical protein
LFNQAIPQGRSFNMKLFRVRFTTDYGLTPFGEVENIIDTSQVLGLNLKLHSGGWNRGEPTTCFHEWKSEADPEMVKNFLEKRYGKSLIEIFLEDMNIGPESSHTQGDQTKSND